LVWAYISSTTAEQKVVVSKSRLVELETSPELGFNLLMPTVAIWVQL